MGFGTRSHEGVMKSGDTLGPDGSEDCGVLKKCDIRRRSVGSQIRHPSRHPTGFLLSALLLAPSALWALLTLVRTCSSLFINPESGVILRLSFCF